MAELLAPAIARTRRRPGVGMLALVAGTGVVAGTAVAVAAARHAAETRTSPLEPAGAWKPALVAGALAAFGCYAVGLVALRRRTAVIGVVCAVAAAVQLVPLAAPLLLSRDAYLYWDYGREVTVHHGNPYSEFPDRWSNDPAYREMSTAWARLRSPYGPAWTLVDEADARLAGSSPAAATRFFRVLAAALVLLAVAVVAWSTRSAFATALVGWNPLLALHFAGGGHADAAMMALVAVALALSQRHPRSAGAAWAAAVAVKVAALAFLGVEVVYRLRERARPWFVGLVGGGAVAIAAATALFGPAWLRSAGPISNQLRESNSIGLPSRIAQLGISENDARAIVALAFVVLYLWILREAWRGRRRLSLAAVGLCLTIAWLQPWYGSWAVVLAAFDGDVAGTLLGVALSGYVLLDALPL